jgi:ACS family glucarate transporter-like MFS transporter
MKASSTASRVRYSVVMLAISLAMLSYVQRVSISQAAGPISRDLHISKQQMGLIFGAFGLSYALFEIPMGLLGDRLGVKRCWRRSFSPGLPLLR